MEQIGSIFDSVLSCMCAVQVTVQNCSPSCTIYTASRSAATSNGFWLLMMTRLLGKHRVSQFSTTLLRCFHFTTRWLYCVECPQDSKFGSTRACRRATKNSTAWQPTTARLLVMATNNNTVFTVPFRSIRRWQKCNRRRTLQKIWGAFLYGVYRTAEWLLIDYNGIKMETRHPVDGSLGSEFPAITQVKRLLVSELR